MAQQNTVEIAIKALDLASKVFEEMGDTLENSMKQAEKSAKDAERSMESIGKEGWLSAERIGKAFQSVGGVLQDVGNTVSNVGSNMSKWITAPILGLATGLTATGIGFKGFEENTQTAFTTLLGSSKAAQDHLDNMMTFAKGTPFAYPSLAKSSQQMVAFGIEADKNIDILQAVGDQVVALGGGNREVEDLSAIFARISAQGKITGMDLESLGRFGIKALDLLANQAGISSDEMRKKISKGAIGSKTAIDGLVKGMQEGTKGINGATIGTAGAMEEAEGTWTGALDSLKGAWRRAGAAIISDDLFEKMKGSLGQVTQIINQLPIILGPVVDTLSNLFMLLIDKAMALSDWFMGLSPSIQEFVAWIGLALVALGPLLVVLGKVITVVGGVVSAFGKVILAVKSAGGIIGLLTGPVGIAIAVIGALITIGVLLYKNWETIKEKAQVVFTAFAPLLETVKGAFKNLVDSVTPIWESLKTLFQSLLPILELLGALVGGVLVVAFGVAISVFNAVVSAIGPLVNAVINLADIIVNMVNVVVALLTGDFAGAWDYLMDIAQSVKDFVYNIFDGIVNYVSTFINSIIEFFHGLYMTLVGNSIIPDMVNAIFDWFKKMGQWLSDIVKSLVSSVVGFFTGLYNQSIAVFNIFVSAARAIWNALKTLILSVATTIFNSVVNVWKRVQSVSSSVWSGITSVISNTINNLSSRVSSVFSRIRSIIQSVWNAISSSTSNIWNGITSTIRGAINGVIGAINGMLGAISRIKITLPKIPDWIPGIGGKGGGTIGFPNIGRIPALATGGVVSRPTLAVVGDAGQGNPEIVAPQRMIRTIIKEELQSILSKLRGSGSGEPREIIIPVIIDGREVARVTAPYIDRELGRRRNDKTRAEGGL